MTTVRIVGGLGPESTIDYYRRCRLGVAVLWACAFVAGLPDVAWSQCPATGSICAAYERAELVFVGDVESMQPDAGPTRSGVVTRVTFRILQGLKGTLGEELTLSLGPSSEEFSYRKGQRVLVYANRLGEKRSTECTRTREVALTDSEVAVLRALKVSEDGGVIDGFVQMPEPLRARRLGDVRVVISRDGVVVGELKTNGIGRFTTGWLPPGTYELSVPGQGAIQGSEKRRQVVVSPKSGCLQQLVLEAPAPTGAPRRS